MLFPNIKSGKLISGIKTEPSSVFPFHPSIYTKTPISTQKYTWPGLLTKSYPLAIHQ